MRRVAEWVMATLLIPPLVHKNFGIPNEQCDLVTTEGLRVFTVNDNSSFTEFEMPYSRLGGLHSRILVPFTHSPPIKGHNCPPSKEPKRIMALLESPKKWTNMVLVFSSVSIYTVEIL